MKPAPIPGSRQQHLLELLDATPTGLTADEYAPLVGISIANAAEVMRQLRLRGAAVVSVNDPKGKARHRFRMFSMKHAARAQRILDSRNPKAIAKAKALALDPAAPATNPHGVKPDSPEPWVDRRFAVDEPEPFFSGLRIGSYINRDTAIARAYGGGR